MSGMLRNYWERAGNISSEKNIPSIYTISFVLFSTLSFLILKRLFYLMSPGLEDGLHPKSLANLRPSHIFMKYLKSICAQDKGARTKVSSDFLAYRGSDRLRSKVTSEAYIMKKAPLHRRSLWLMLLQPGL